MQRQHKTECGTLSLVALDPHFPVMAFDDLIGDVEADAQTGEGLFNRPRDLVKAFKNLLLVGLINADAEILYTHESILSGGGEPDNDLTARWRILNSIGK